MFRQPFKMFTFLGMWFCSWRIQSNKVHNHHYVKVITSILAMRMARGWRGRRRRRGRSPCSWRGSPRSRPGCPPLWQRQRAKLWTNMIIIFTYLDDHWSAGSSWQSMGWTQKGKRKSVVYVFIVLSRTYKHTPIILITLIISKMIIIVSIMGWWICTLSRDCAPWRLGRSHWQMLLFPPLSPATQSHF